MAKVEIFENCQMFRTSLVLILEKKFKYGVVQGDGENGREMNRVSRIEMVYIIQPSFTIKENLIVILIALKAEWVCDAI